MSSSDKYDLEFDPQTMDIVCRRDADGTCHFNIRQAVVHHSPSGMNWGYGGSGAADFALSVLEVFCAGDKNRTKIYQGKTCSRLAWNLHQDFKWQFIATLPPEGGTIKGAVIRQWIEQNKTPLLVEAQEEYEEDVI